MKKGCPCPACQRERKLERYIKPLNKEAKEWIRGLHGFLVHVEQANRELADSIMEDFAEEELGRKVERRERRLRRRRR